MLEGLLVLVADLVAALAFHWSMAAWRPSIGSRPVTIGVIESMPSWPRTGPWAMLVSEKRISVGSSMPYLDRGLEDLLQLLHLVRGFQRVEVRLSTHQVDQVTPFLAEQVVGHWHAVLVAFVSARLRCRS